MTNKDPRELGPSFLFRLFYNFPLSHYGLDTQDSFLCVESTSLFQEVLLIPFASPGLPMAGLRLILPVSAETWLPSRVFLCPLHLKWWLPSNSLAHHLFSFLIKLITMYNHPGWLIVFLSLLTRP